MTSRAELRHRVSVQTRTETPDGHDGLVETWTTQYARKPARVRPMLGRDLERAKQVDPRISHEVTLPFWRAYRTDLAGGRARFIYHPSNTALEDRIFEAVGPPLDVDEAHVSVTVACRELT